MDRWAEKFWVRAAAILVPSINIALTVTNELHGLVWNGFYPTGNNVVIFGHGPGFTWVAVSGYVVMSFILVALLRASLYGSTISRRQGRMLLLAGLFTVATNQVYLLGIEELRGIDFTSLTFSVVALIFIQSLRRTHLLELAPIARSQLINNLADGVVVIDLQNRITDVNPAAETILQKKHDAVIGTDLAQLLPSIGCLKNLHVEKECRADFEVELSEKRYYELAASPLYEQSSSQRKIGTLVIFHEVTEQRKTELHLKRLNQAVEENPASIVITDPDGRITYVNPQFTKLTGYSYEEANGQNPNILKSGLTPLSTYQEMWAAIQAGETWRGEFLNKKKNGELYWEDATITSVTDENGKILNYLTVKVDITKRKQIEQALSASEERFRTLVTSAPDAVFGVGRDGNIVFANHEAYELLGYAEGELTGKPIEVLVPEHLRDVHAAHRTSYAADPRLRNMGARAELRAKRKDGQEIPVEINLSYSSTQNGPLVIAFMRDITQRKQAEIELRNANNQLEQKLQEIEALQKILQEQAIRDPLTGLHNRRYYKDTIVRELSRADREQRPICFLLIDIDHFKSINDRYGHATGDLVLQRLSNQLREHTRTEDIVCRYGGEEFLVVLTDTPLQAAAQTAERLRSTFEHMPIVENGYEIYATISCGISEYPTNGDTESEVLDLADKALYEAKHNGRNQVVVWTASKKP